MIFRQIRLERNVKSELDLYFLTFSPKNLIHLPAVLAKTVNFHLMTAVFVFVRH